MLISEYDKNRLAVKTLQHEYTTNEYLINEQDENFKYIRSKFFALQSTKTTKTLNVGSGLFEAISDTYKYYVWSPVGALSIDLTQSTNDFFSNWYILLLINAIDWKYNIERVPTNLHYYSYDINADVILRLYSKPTWSLNEYDNYLLHTAYYENRIENKLYKLWKDCDYNLGNEVELTEVQETKDLESVEQTTYKPLRTIKQDNLEQYPVSEAQKIKPLVYSIDRKTVMFETQFLRNTETLKLFKWMVRPKNKDNFTISYQDTWHEIYTTNSDASVEFIDNMNSLITEAIEYESSQIRRISSITKIPTDFLWLDNAHWAIWEGSRSILHWSFFKKIRNIQSLYDTQLKEIYEIVAKENWVNETYTRPDVYVKDDKILLEELIQAKNENIITHTRAIMEYMNINEEQAETEKEQIMKDNKEAMDLLNKETDVNQTQIWQWKDSGSDPEVA